MEELVSAVTKALGESPQLALWVLVIVYLYKAIVVGSVYGVIRYCVNAVRDMYMRPKTKVVEYNFGDISCNAGVADNLRKAIATLPSRGGYVATEDIAWLRQQIAFRNHERRKKFEEDNAPRAL